MARLLPQDLRSAGNEEMDKRKGTTIMSYIGTTMRIHSFIVHS